MVTSSIEAPISPLRQRMPQDMLMRGLGVHTQHNYARHVRCFAAFLGQSPDVATADNIRRYQLHTHENAVSPSTINGTVSALRFLFGVTLKRRDLARALVITRYQRQLPDVLNIEEGGRLLQAAPSIKYKAALRPAYRSAHAGHLSLGQLKVMSAIETCRTAALGGHVEACSDCGHQRIACSCPASAPMSQNWF